jgi:hypothetical protein
MIAAIVDELASNLIARNSIGHGRSRPASRYGLRQSRKIAVRSQLRLIVRREPGSRIVWQDRQASRKPRRRPGPTARSISLPLDASGPTRETGTTKGAR